MAINPINPSNLMAKVTEAAANMKGPSVGPSKLKSFAPSVSGTSALGGSDGITGFADMMEKAVRDVNAQQSVAAEKVGKMSTGEVSINEALMTMECADLNFRMMTQVRNKVVDAYKEIMRLSF